MLTEASSATMYANTCGTRIFTADSAPPQALHHQRRVDVVEAVTGLSSTGVIRLPHSMHALIYICHNNSIVYHEGRSFLPDYHSNMAHSTIKSGRSRHTSATVEMTDGGKDEPANREIAHSLAMG